MIKLRQMEAKKLNLEFLRLKVKREWVDEEELMDDPIAEMIENDKADHFKGMLL